MKIDFEDALWAKVKKHSEAAGYSSPEEFVQHAVEKQLATAASPQEDQESARKTKGLGYLDPGLDI